MNLIRSMFHRRTGRRGHGRGRRRGGVKWFGGIGLQTFRTNNGHTMFGPFKFSIRSKKLYQCIKRMMNGTLCWRKSGGRRVCWSWQLWRVWRVWRVWRGVVLVVVVLLLFVDGRQTFVKNGSYQSQHSTGRHTAATSTKQCNFLTVGTDHTAGGTSTVDDRTHGTNAVPQTVGIPSATSTTPTTPTTSSF